METWQAVLLGLIEGLTEYLPVSSTAHLLLTEQLFVVSLSGRTFEVLIQLGAILALLTAYSEKLWGLAVDFPNDLRARHFVVAVLLAFLPAIFVGVAAHKFIKGFLFESPMIICISLVIGGIILLIVDRMRYRPRYIDAMDIPLLEALIIGFVQCLAMIPGVSRSGSTIVGGMLLGADKRAAAEFSFFLAMPTMTGAFAYDLYKNWSILTPREVSHIVFGSVAAFMTGAIAVRYMLDFISTRCGLSLFGWWRLVVGSVGLGALAVLR